MLKNFCEECGLSQETDTAHSLGNSLQHSYFSSFCSEDFQKYGKDIAHGWSRTVGMAKEKLMPAKYSVLGMQNFHPLLLIIRVLNEHKLEVKLENWSIVELSEFDYCQNCGAQLFGNENISIMWRNTCPPTATPFTAPLVESNTAENLDDWPRLGTNSETLFAEIISTKHNQILWL